MRKKNLYKLLILIAILAVIVVIVVRFLTPEDTWLCKGGVWVRHGNPEQGPPSTECGNLKLNDYNVACTEEAMLCPDGSAVGRSGPKCEFAACPASDDQNSLYPFDSGVSGKVTIGPSCPVRREGDSNCLDKPYSVDIQVILMGSPMSSPFATIKSNNDGNFKLMLPPGDYTLQPVSTGKFPNCETKNIKIEPAKVATTNILCDTGIR